MKSAIFALGLLALSVCSAKEVSVHDPVMAKEGDTWYVFSTGPGITFYSSRNMKDWTPEGRVFRDQPVWAKRAAPTFDGHIWAPDVHFHNGQYYLYYSVSGFGKNTSGIGVTVNKTLNPRSPDYRWEDKGMVLQSVPLRDDWNAIDPNIVEDGKDGAWMAFGSFWSGLKLVKLNADWTGLAEPQEWHAIASRSRGPSVAGQSAGPDEIEAPFVFKKGDYYYLFASFGLCCRKGDSTYYVVVGRSRNVTGPYVDRNGVDMLKGGGSTVIAGDKDWKGLGHNSAYTIDGKDFLVLHAYETADNYLQKLKIMEMKWDASGWPVVDAADLNRYRSNQLPSP
ncbi:arabinan endo-1,5-alpha-L-arabinosidase [Duganella violaceipulchra]|uniref:Extracellular exo-alpha-(1->5)-L-arabinofuranosidase n=1 Tax=Duganella violaceipulchra TaxID=2849652 RepID=A0AA41H620_9BURK|nr:arabinan endo-1,5-alpha-L-arabinosidase [Duganella violaceicalia]MBV6319820.1 arabinan endo-1,5-alpha-L-arabinosidase [Duganella violaceicalia]MCP2006363.1 arabinan endo-1,5-alpha-L-arabinosidase [Duganella violaceicalia]